MALDIDTLLELPRTQKTAAKRGFTHFFTNKECLNGHLAERNTKGGRCSECIRVKKGSIQRRVSRVNGQLAEYAMSEGVGTYVPENCCKYGHFERFVASGNCVECCRLTQLKNKESRRLSRFRKTYGLSPEELESLKAATNGACAICGDKPNNERSMHVDHCHDTGRIRGFLCSRCNQGIGLFLNSTDRLMAAVSYLKGVV